MRPSTSSASQLGSQLWLIQRDELPQGVDDPAVLQLEVKGVVRVVRVVGVAVLGLVPVDDLAHVLDQGFAGGDVLHRIHPLAVHAGAAGLDAAGRGSEGLFGHGLKIWYGQFVWARVRPRMGVRLRTRDNGIVIR